MQNPDIARLFDEVADLLEIQDANPFRVRAYRNAARTIRDFPEPIADLVRAGTKDLTDIAGIGDDLAEKITDIVTTGELPLRKELASKLPAGDRKSTRLNSSHSQISYAVFCLKKKKKSLNKKNLTYTMGPGRPARALVTATRVHSR